MPDEPNTTQNKDSEKNSIPTSPQGTSEPASINTTGSEPSNMPLEAPESPKNADIPVSLNNPNLENEPILTPSPEEAIPLEPTDLPANPASNRTNEPLVEPVSETRTAQIPVNEPFTPEPEVKPELIPISQMSQPKISLARELLVKARNMIQFRKKKKLDRVMTLFLKKSKITNDEVREFLHVSDATAERYLNTLEKEGKIKQTGKTGHAVFYQKVI